MEHRIDDVYYDNELKYNLLCVSQICDKGIENMYITELNTARSDSLTCFSAQSENVDVGHTRRAHVSASLIHKLVSRDLVYGLPKIKFADYKVCDACVKEKHIRQSFKRNKQNYNILKNFWAEVVNITCSVTKRMILSS